MSDSSKLALLGGKPIAPETRWSLWPIPEGTELQELATVVGSHRWTVRSSWRGSKSQEQLLCEEFAAFTGANHACTAQTGTAALVLALEGLGIGAGDEVIVPGLTWVACATAVLHVNAEPVFVDVDPRTLVMTASAFEAAITPRTACVMPVHWHGQMVDMDAIVGVARRRGIRVLEDCAQAPGGLYREGRHVGTIGDAGIFSLHNDKLLTSGEGGLVITNHKDVWERMQVRRLDGFVWSDEPLRAMDGWFQENGFGPMLGTSNTMSEFQAAVARCQLRQLRAFTERRERSGEELCRLIAEIRGFDPIPRQSYVQTRPFYEFTCRCDPTHCDDVTIETLAWALQSELGFPIYPEGAAIPEHPTYQPQVMKRYACFERHLAEMKHGGSRMPVARDAQNSHLMFLHPPLLEDTAAMNLIGDAFAKVSMNIDTLRGVECDAHGNVRGMSE
jgi:L-glutamine:2-deoxy-scyllo-inosose/3-amino-2,3-dideoxy-scyllo-inosose aminotransferase